MHLSIPIENTVQVIERTEVSPLISKCQIKVLYVSDEPNRNGSVITKEVATEMGRKLPGSPVVGFFNEEEEDYEQHSREITIRDDEFKMVDLTKPYGFVPTDAKVWFQKFTDDNKIEREYLVTECYIWDDIYPESKRIIEKGNNQSMELSEKFLDGHWAKKDNSYQEFFIINEAVIEKLCILGEDVEPCFEGAQIKREFSLFNDEIEKLRLNLFSCLQERGLEYKMNDEKEKKVDQEPEQKKTNEKPEEEKKVDEKSKEEEEKKVKENSKQEYNLEEIKEYADLQEKYSQLETNFNKLNEEIVSLREFKATIEKTQKEELIDKFFMLSEEDKKDVVTNIDKYSLDEIESKLSVLCFRNKVSFSLDDEKEEKQPEMNFNLNSMKDQEDEVPAWIRSIKSVASDNE